MICRRGVVGRVPAFQSGGPGSIPGGSGILTSVLGLGVCPFSVFCTVFVSGRGPGIVLATHSGRPALVYLSSILVQRLLLPLQVSDPGEFGL